MDDDMADDVFLFGNDEEGNECDFCGREAGADDPGKDYVAGEVSSGVITHAPGTWWACTPCARLIDADDYEGLARRAAAWVGAEYRELYLIQIRAVHQAFRAARLEVQ